jgi:hypothetical protein
MYSSRPFVYGLTYIPHCIDRWTPLESRYFPCLSKMEAVTDFLFCEICGVMVKKERREKGKT